MKIVIIPVLLSTLFLVSCASAPEEPQETAAAELEMEVETDTLEEAPDDKAVEEARADAESARNAAIEVKAPRAAADEYDSAQSLFEQAGEAGTQSDYAKAADLYKQSAAGFLASAEAASKAREEALAAMAEADKVITDSETAADEATRTAREEE